MCICASYIVDIPEVPSCQWSQICYILGQLPSSLSVPLQIQPISFDSDAYCVGILISIRRLSLFFVLLSLRTVLALLSWRPSSGNNGAPPPLNLLILCGIFVIDKKFSVLAEASWFRKGNFDDIKSTSQTVHVVEDLVHFF